MIVLTIKLLQIHNVAMNLLAFYELIEIISLRIEYSKILNFRMCIGFYNKAIYFMKKADL